jgi:hypothetical protein
MAYDIPTRLHKVWSRHLWEIERTKMCGRIIIVNKKCVHHKIRPSIVKRYNGNDPKINRFFPFHRGIMWSSLVKIQNTELKLSCGNDPVVKNSIYSNGDLDLWPNDPKINRVLPLPQRNHVAKFVKDPIYRTKFIVRKRPCCQKFYLK